MVNSVLPIQSNLVCSGLSLRLFQNSLPISSEVAQGAHIPRGLQYIECLCLHKNHMLKPNLQCMVLGGGVFGKRLGHEDGALMNGISLLIKETPESSLTHSAT